MSGPNWVDVLVKWIGIATTIIGAVAALLIAVGKFGEAQQSVCKPFPSMPWCSAPTPPKLAPYTSQETSGPGNTQAKFCDPVANAYRSQYPDFEITWTGSEVERRDILAKVYRTYHCEFAATAKPRPTSSGLYFALGALAIGLLALLYYRRRKATFAG